MMTERPPGPRQKFYFQYVTTPTSDTPGTTLLLHFDSQRYLFGRIAEGTQRACVQQGVGIKKVRDIFLTGQTTWQNMGGLIGMVLTMADVQLEERDEVTGKRPKLSIHGGPKLYHAIACARRFVFRTGMPVSIHEARTDKGLPTSTPDYVDDNINVWSLPIIPRRGKAGEGRVYANGRSASPNTVDREQAIRQNTVHNMFDSDWRKDRLVDLRFDEVKLPAVVFIRDPETKQLSEFRCTTMQDAPHLRPETKVLVRNPWPAALVEELPPADNLAGSVAVSYIVKGHRQRGNFLPQKAKELGVKPGPNYAVLATGESVTLEDGTVITSDMVVSPPEPAKGMAIFDIPSVEYLGDLLENIEQLTPHGVMQGIEMATWQLGKDVVHSSAFHKIIVLLTHVNHFVSAPETNLDYIAFESSATSLLKLSSIRPECFPPPVRKGGVPGKLSGWSFNPEIKIQSVERGLILQIQPKPTVSRDEVTPPLNIDNAEYKDNKSVRHLLPTSAHVTASTPYDDIEILTLGTGSAMPSKYRNVSASLIRIPGLGNYLIDAGEGTLGQLRRMFSSDELDDVLYDLRMLWISHLHADHHLGTTSVILARDEVLRRRGITNSNMYLISEPNMSDFITDYASIQTTENCVLLTCLNSQLSKDGESISIGQTSLPIKEFATTRVSHCHGAQAVSITFENGFKFSYSGDCRPSANFAAIGADSHVLLHEATFDDGMEGDARAKKHSTTGEALGVAVQMRAKHVILTHFSQRYQKIPVLNTIKFADAIGFEEADEQDQGPVGNHTGTVAMESESASIENVPNQKSTFAEVAAQLHICVAFDLMRVNVCQIRDMHMYYRAIEKMLELDAIKSAQKRQEAAAQQEQLNANKKAKAGAKSQSFNGAKQQKQPKQTNGTSRKPGDEGQNTISSSAPKPDIYAQINRNKSAKSTVQNTSQSSPLPDSTTEHADPTPISDQISPDSTTETPELSKSALKRIARKQERSQLRSEKRHAASLAEKTEKDGPTDDRGKVRSEADEGGGDIKRRKLTETNNAV